MTIDVTLTIRIRCMPCRVCVIRVLVVSLLSRRDRGRHALGTSSMSETMSVAEVSHGGSALSHGSEIDLFILDYCYSTLDHADRLILFRSSTLDNHVTSSFRLSTSPLQSRQPLKLLQHTFQSHQRPQLPTDTHNPRLPRNLLNSTDRIPDSRRLNRLPHLLHTHERPQRHQTSIQHFRVHNLLGP